MSQRDTDRHDQPTNGHHDHDPIKIDVYYDYLCPFAHEATTWLRRAKEELGDRLQINWRYFPIEQVNSEFGPDWKLWEQTLDFPAQGLLAFRAAVAAREQGEEAFERFHHEVMALRHIQKRTLTRRATILQVAERAGLDLARFERDLDDESLASRIGADYEHGRERHGVFGTPTLVTPDGHAVYVQVMPAPDPHDAVPVLKEVLGISQRRPYVREIKRSVPPSQAAD